MENHLVIKRNEILIKAIMWMNLKNIMLSENTWCKRSYILITFIFLFPLVALNLFSLFYSNWYMLYLGVFLFIFILLRVLCTSCICVVVFFVNFRNVRRYFFKYFYPTLSLFSLNSNSPFPLSFRPWLPPFFLYFDDWLL